MSALAPFPSLPVLALPVSRPRLGRGRGWRLLLRAGLMVVASLGLVGAGLMLATSLLAARPASGPATGPAEATISRWTEIRRPIALYDLAGSDFARLPSTYLARNHEPDGAREDVLSFGRLGDAKPYLQLSLLRAGPTGAVPPRASGEPPVPDAAATRAEGLSETLARLAASRGFTATRIRAAAPVETRLGPMASADLLLSDGEGAVPCLGFRSIVGDGAVLQVGGFACGAPGRPLGRAALACALDRIDLVSAGEDAALREVFVAAERRGAATCLGGTGSSLLRTGRRLGWLDPDGTLPPLRGLFDNPNRQR